MIEFQRHMRCAALCPEASISSSLHCCRVDRNKYQIQIPLPPKIDPTVTMMTVEEKPDVTYSDIGGCKEQVPGCVMDEHVVCAARCMALLVSFRVKGQWSAVGSGTG